VIVETDRTSDDLAFLSAHDDDPFGRYEAMQQLMLDTLVAGVSSGKTDHGPVIEAVRNTLTNNALDAAFIAETVLLPSEAFIGDQMLVVDPDAIHAAREALRADLGRELLVAARLEKQLQAYDVPARLVRSETSPSAENLLELIQVVPTVEHNDLANVS
jgi:aminopeptidase N